MQALPQTEKLDGGGAVAGNAALWRKSVNVLQMTDDSFQRRGVNRGNRILLYI